MKHKRILWVLALVIAVPLTLQSAKSVKSTNVEETKTQAVETPSKIESKESPKVLMENEVVTNSVLSGEQINWQVISGGATNANSTSYHLLGTVGQTAVGMVSSTSYNLNQGYWQDFGSSGGCCGQYASGQTGNCNCDTGGLRDLADITRLIDKVYISKIPLCCPENGNTNGDAGGLVNLADITRLIDHVYISKEETAACE